jgi:hypothetical protein
MGFVVLTTTILYSNTHQDAYHKDVTIRCKAQILIDPPPLKED